MEAKIADLPARATPTEATVPRLEIAGLSKRFGATRALSDVSFSLLPGEVHVIAGANGAGKSTLIRILSGVHQDYTGEIRLDGRSVRFQSPADARAQGVATIHQELSLVPSLSVADNLLLATKGRALALRNRSAERAHARRVLALLDLDVSVDAELGTLGLGERQLIEIARCMAETARVFILDEPTSALQKPEAERLFALISRVTQSGASVVYISHRIPEIYRLAQRISVLADGKLVLTRAPAELSEPELVRAMVGRTLAEPTRVHAELRSGAAHVPLLAVDGLCSARSLELQGVSFELARGEVLGVSGLMSSGASELVSALYGLREFQGRVELAGQRYRPREPRDALSRGVAFLAADRRDSVIAELSVEHNATLSSLERRGRFGIVDRRAEREVVAQGAAEFGIKAASARARASTLSGGNQQKLALLRCLLTEPSLLLLDEPTRGVDVAAKAEIHARIRERAAAGLAVLVFSSEPEELLALCERVLVFARGRIARELSGSALEREALQRALMGAEP